MNLFVKAIVILELYCKNWTFISKVEPMKLNAVAYLSIFRLSGSDDNSESCRALSELSDPSRDRDQ